MSKSQKPYKNNHFVPLVLLSHWRKSKPVGKGTQPAVWRYEIRTKRRLDRWSKTPVPFPWFSSEHLYVVVDGEQRDISLELLFGTYEQALGEFVEFCKEYIAHDGDSRAIGAQVPDMHAVLRALVSLETRSPLAMHKVIEFVQNNPELRAGADPNQLAIVNLQAQIAQGISRIGDPQGLILYASESARFIISDTPSVQVFAGLGFEQMGIPGGARLLALTDQIAIAYFSADSSATAWGFTGLRLLNQEVEAVNALLTHAATEIIVAATEAERDHWADFKAAQPDGITYNVIQTDGEWCRVDLNHPELGKIEIEYIRNADGTERLTARPPTRASRRPSGSIEADIGVHVYTYLREQYGIDTAEPIELLRG